jgi:lipoyl-dependent peroxiredoxin
MLARTSEAEWKGDLPHGGGRVKLGSGAFEGPYTFKSRLESGPGTNPEELIAAAHAGCFSMAFALGLSTAGHTPTRVHTTAKVYLDKADGGFVIPRIDLDTEAEVPGLDEATFRRLAEDAKKNCPVSKVLAGAQIHLQAKLMPGG